MPFLREIKVIAVAACAMACMPLAAQGFPDRTIRVVTGDVGGTADIVSRILAQSLSTSGGTQVIVDNRGGANGAVASQAVAKAPADGYTLLFYATALFIAPLMSKTPWDPMKDLVPISLVATSPNVLVVHPSLPVRSVQELVALAKSKPGALNYASGGLGGAPHLAAELFKSMAKVDIVRVAYKGTGPALNDLIGGHVQLMFSPTGPVVAHVKSGRLRAVAVTSLKPSPLASGLPTVASSGLPGFVQIFQAGMFAPVATPTAVTAWLNKAIVQVLQRPDVVERLLSIGVEAVSSSPDEFSAAIKSEVALMGKVIREAGIREE